MDGTFGTLRCERAVIDLLQERTAGPAGNGIWFVQPESPDPDESRLQLVDQLGRGDHMFAPALRSAEPEQDVK